jgi:hypothetical protein
MKWIRSQLKKLDVLAKKNAWTDENVIDQWIKDIWMNIIDVLDDNLLICDSLNLHKERLVSELSKINKNTTVKINSSHLTPYL